MTMPDLFVEVGELLCKYYGCGPSKWLCDRTLEILFSGQYYIKRNLAGEITTYVGWWLIDRENLDKVTTFQHVPADIRNGNTIWVMDAVSVDGTGIREVQRQLRRIYPRTGEIKGVAWLRESKRAVISMRQRGV